MLAEVQVVRLVVEVKGMSVVQESWSSHFTGVDKMAHKPIKGTQATKRCMSHKEGAQAMENSEIKGKHSTDVAGGSGKGCEIKLDLGKSSKGNFKLCQAVRRVRSDSVGPKCDPSVFDVFYIHKYSYNFSKLSSYLKFNFFRKTSVQTVATLCS